MLERENASRIAGWAAGLSLSMASVAEAPLRPPSTETAVNNISKTRLVVGESRHVHSASQPATQETVPEAPTTLQEIEEKTISFLKSSLELGTVLGIASFLATFILLKRKVIISEVSFGISDLQPLAEPLGSRDRAHRFSYATCFQTDPSEIFKFHFGTIAKFYSEVAGREIARLLKSIKRVPCGDDLTQIFFNTNLNGESTILNRVRSGASEHLNDNRHVDKCTANANQRALQLFLPGKPLTKSKTESLLDELRLINRDKVFVVSFDEIDMKKLRVHLCPLTDLVHLLVHLKDWRQGLLNVTSVDRSSLEKKFVRMAETAALLISQYPDYIYYVSPTLRRFPDFSKSYAKAFAIAEDLKRLGPLDERAGLALIDDYLRDPTTAQTKLSEEELRRLNKKMFGTSNEQIAMVRRANRRKLHRGEPADPKSPLAKSFVKCVCLPSED